MSAEEAVLPPAAAEMVTAVDVVTVPAVTVNVELVAPSGTTTLAGTVAAAVLLLVKVTVVPAVGAGPLSVTVAVDVAPLAMALGLSVRDRTAGAAVTVSVADRVTPPPLAEIDDDVLAVTG